MKIKRNVYILFTIIFLQGFVFYGPIATLYRQSRGLGLGEIFLIESCCLAIMILLEIPWGWIADRIGYKRTLILANGFFFISKIIFWRAFGFYSFLLERIFLAVAVSGISGCDQALLYESIDNKNSDKVFSHYAMISSLGFLLASGISSFIIQFGMEWTSFFTIFPYGISLILSFFLKDLDHLKKSNTSIFKNIKVAISNKNIVYIVVAAAMLFEINQAITVFLNQNLYIKASIPITYFGLILIIVQIVRLSAGKSYKLVRRFGNFNTLLAICLLIGIICSLLIFTKSPFVAILGVASIAGLVSISQPIVSDFQNKSISSGDRATLLSIYAMIIDCIGIPSNIIIGRFSNINFVYGFAICSMMAVLALLFVYLAKKSISSNS
ncbi:MAG: MFS transporter [Tissierellales bacterium]|jgi:MFS family permease|nr:MFS transporter [Tissierellales bacterium]